MSRPGRPPLDQSGQPTADVHLTLAAKDYDRAEELAKKSRESIQELIRRGLKRLIETSR
jgi:hypothetical protein